MGKAMVGIPLVIQVAMRVSLWKDLRTTLMVVWVTFISNTLSYHLLIPEFLSWIRFIILAYPFSFFPYDG